MIADNPPPPAWIAQLQAHRLRLSRILRVRPESSGVRRETLVAGRWVSWVGRVPRDLPDLIRRAVRFVLFKRTTPDRTTQLCLCLDIPSCPRKASGEAENFSCARFAFGVCVSATMEANHGEPLSIDVIGALSGMSKQGFSRHVEAAQVQMIRKILADPELRDYCKSIGMERVTGAACP